MLEERITVGENVASVNFSKTIYEKEALISASYGFTEKYGVNILENDADFVTIFIHKSPNTFDASAMKEDLLLFMNEVLDEQLRLHLNSKTSRLREIIVQHAFSPIENLREELEKIDL